MPETGGEVAAQIQSDPALHRTPIFFLTALVTKAGTRSDMRIEGHPFLAKLLCALHSIYIALAAFTCATLVTLLGAGLMSVAGVLLLHAVAGLGIALGFVGVGGLVVACLNLFRATHLSVLNIRDEAKGNDRQLSVQRSLLYLTASTQLATL